MTTALRVAGATRNRPTMSPSNSLPSSGRMIVLEGPDGAGKTTAAQELVAVVRRMGRSVLGLREPGGHPGAEAMRAALLGQSVPHGSARALFGYSAARAMLVEDVIRPALADGTWVVLDRWTPSTFVYQGEEGVAREDIKWANRLSTGGLEPDHLFLLTADPQVLSDRLADRTRREGGTVDARERGLTLAKIAHRTQMYREVVAGMGGQEVDTSLFANPEEVVGHIISLMGIEAPVPSGQAPRVR